MVAVVNIATIKLCCFNLALWCKWSWPTVDCLLLLCSTDHIGLRCLTCSVINNIQHTPNQITVTWIDSAETRRCRSCEWKKTRVQSLNNWTATGRKMNCDRKMKLEKGCLLRYLNEQRKGCTMLHVWKDASRKLSYHGTTKYKIAPTLGFSTGNWIFYHHHVKFVIQHSSKSNLVCPN